MLAPTPGGSALLDQVIRRRDTVRVKPRILSLLIPFWLACGDADLPPGPFNYLLTEPSGAFLQVSSYDTTGGNRDRLEILPGDTAVILDATGPGVIQRIWITVSSRDPHYLRRIALRMYWDDETVPSVQAPLGDFFGNGFDRRHYVAQPMGVSSGGFYCYLPMPFRKRARIVVENGTGLAIDAFYFNIGVAQVQRLPPGTPTFHAAWRRTLRTDQPEPHPVLEARGRGYFVGLALNAESYTGRLWFLEGDERFTVDGEVRGQGTGTEDYFNGGWYFEAGPFSGPYHGLILKDDSLGRIAAYRWHLPDPIPFRRSIRVDLEHGHDNQEVADYATTAYWYQIEPHEPLLQLPAPSERLTLGVKIPPGALLASSFTIDSMAGDRVIRALVPRPDRYEVVVYPRGEPAGGVASLRLSGGRARRVETDAAETNTVLAPVSLGVTSVQQEVHIEVSGPGVPPPSAIELRPLRQWADAWSIVGPFPNPQVLGTEYSPAVDSIFIPERDPGLGRSYRVINGQATWKRAGISPDGQVRLNPHFTPNDWVAAYAQSFLYSPSDGEGVLLFGADDAHVLWVNGERVSERQGRHISLADELATTVPLRRGWNRILLKVADLDGGWAFQMRVADPNSAYRWSVRPDG